MLKRTFNWFLHIGGILTLIMFMSGCSLLKGPLYPDVIYNNRQPLISVTYEYGEIEIKLPLNYIGVVPEIISFEVYAHGDTANPIISILQEAPRVFFVYLPQGVLDIHNKSNIIKIIPQDKNFRPVTVRFKGIRFGRIALPPKSIQMGQLIVNGKVFLNKNEAPLGGVDVSIQNFDNVIKETTSNDSGFYQLSVPGEYKFAQHLRLVAGNNMIFKPFKQKLDFSQSLTMRYNIGMGPNKAMEDPIYLTNRESVHFREQPDIGSETLFLLGAGEAVSVTRVTPGEYYGSIEIEVSSKKMVQLDGWVNRTDVFLLDLNNVFKKESGDALEL